MRMYNHQRGSSEASTRAELDSSIHWEQCILNLYNRTLNVCCKRERYMFYNGSVSSARVRYSVECSARVELSPKRIPHACSVTRRCFLVLPQFAQMSKPASREKIAKPHSSVAQQPDGLTYFFTCGIIQILAVLMLNFHNFHEVG